MKPAARAHRMACAVLFCKSVLGFSIALLAVLGFSTQLLPYEPSLLSEGAAAVVAAVGAVVGLPG